VRGYEPAGQGHTVSPTTVVRWHVPSTRQPRRAERRRPTQRLRHENETLTETGPPRNPRYEIHTRVAECDEGEPGVSCARGGGRSGTVGPRTTEPAG